MNDGKINATELRENINEIKKYADKEQELLQKIMGSFNELEKYYNGGNSYKLTNNQGLITYHSNIMMDNRKKYITIINKVMLLYQETARKVSNVLNSKLK